MKLEKQVTSLEISKRLKELGVKQDSLFSNCGGSIHVSMSDDCYDYWLEEHYKHRVKWFEDIKNYSCSVFTVSELGEMLSGDRLIKSYYCNKDKEWVCCLEQEHNGNGYMFKQLIAATEANARGEMLIYLLENNLVKAKDL